MALAQFCCPYCQSAFMIDVAPGGCEALCPTCHGTVLVPGNPSAGAVSPPVAANDAVAQLACPHCLGVFGVDATLTGQQAMCPHCAAAVLIPPEMFAPPTVAPPVQPPSGALSPIPSMTAPPDAPPPPVAPRVVTPKVVTPGAAAPPVVQRVELKSAARSMPPDVPLVPSTSKSAGPSPAAATGPPNRPILAKHSTVSDKTSRDVVVRTHRTDKADSLLPPEADAGVSLPPLNPIPPLPVAGNDFVSSTTAVLPSPMAPLDQAASPLASALHLRRQESTTTTTADGQVLRKLTPQERARVRRRRNIVLFVISMVILAILFAVLRHARILKEIGAACTTRNVLTVTQKFDYRP